MKFIALVIALLGLAVGIFAVASDVPDYNRARSAWMSMGNAYNNPAYERVSATRDKYYGRVETEGVVTLAAAALSLILGIIAIVKKGGGVAVAAVVVGVLAGVCGGIIATTPGIF